MKKPMGKLWGRIAAEHGSAAAFAQALSFHPSKVSRVLHGHIELTSEEKARWAAALNAEVSEVFPEESTG